MNNLFSNSVSESANLPGAQFFSTNFYNTYNASSRRKDVMPREIAFQMATGRIPDLREVCAELADNFHQSREPYAAMAFVPALEKLQTFDRLQVSSIIKNPVSRHVLLSTHHFELVLNLWKPGKASEIHGHPGGGCVFKLLYGKLEELRFCPGSSPKLLSTSSLRKGDLAYIDNSIAYHQVGNPYGSPAISLHAYIK